MKTARKLPFLLFLAGLSLPVSSRAQSTAFTYQGRLDNGSAPYTGSAEFQATLWNAASGGSQVAANSTAQIVVAVTNGLFVLPLDFGANFPGAERWVQLAVRTVLGPFTPLSPRQRLTAEVKHVGPMAQDFRAAFGLGEMATAIATVDADGVALSVIQGLNQKVEAKDKRIAELERRNEKLKRLMNGENGGGR